MVEKNKRRADRRWRSYCVWMRRLKKDWASHGRQYNIYPVYDYSRAADGSLIQKLVGWRNNLCKCFDLKNKEALRFKDTPNTNSFRRKDWDLYRDGRGINVPIQELRSLPVDRETYGNRKRRDVIRLQKIRCSCGYLLKTVYLKNSELYDYKGKYWGTKYGWPRCPGCKRKQREEKA